MARRKALARLTGPTFHFISTDKDALLRMRLAALLPPGIHLAIVDAAAPEGLFSAFATAFHFPDYFGSNWDALDECLNDLAWLPANGYVLVLNHSASLVPDSVKLAILVSVLLRTIREWRTRNISFHVIFGVQPTQTVQVRAALQAAGAGEIVTLEG